MDPKQRRESWIAGARAEAIIAERNRASKDVPRARSILGSADRRTFVTLVFGSVLVGPRMSTEQVLTSPYRTFYTTTDYQSPPSVVGRPAYRTSYYEPSLWPCRLIRVVDNPGAAVQGLSGRWPKSAYHAYSVQPAWNADGSRLLIARLNFSVMLDGITYLPVSLNTPPNSHFYWHPTMPDRGYLCAGDNTLRWWFHSNGSTEIIKTFSGWGKIGWGKDRVNDSGGIEAAPSNDGDYVPLVGKRRSDSTIHGFIYRISTDTMYGSRAMDSYNHLNVSPNGDYAVEHNDKRVTLYNLDQNLQIASSRSPRCKHQNLAKYNDGQYMVGVDRSNGDVVRKGPFPALTATSILSVGSALHVSARNIHLPDWCFVSMTQDPKRTRETYWNEALMVKLDGSVVRRLARMHCGTRSVGTAYNNEHHLSPSWDGLRAIFATNWHGSDLTSTPPGGDQVGAYVIEGCGYEETTF